MLKIKKIFLILILFKSLALKPFTSLLILSTPKDSGNKCTELKNL